MAYDPKQEDYQRLWLQFARTLDAGAALDATRAYASFSKTFLQSRDSIPQSDADRAFCLASQAVVLIDYNLPFATDEEAETLISRARTLLDEAISLDPTCYDAIRMQVAATMPTFEGYYDFLREQVNEVRAYCEKERDEAVRNAEGSRSDLAADLAMRPYARWLAMLASKAVICGRNREALRYADELLLLDPRDQADVRYTAAIALAKLEDDQGLDALEKRTLATVRGAVTYSAWFRLARASLAFRRRDFSDARAQLKGLTESYPRAAVALGIQRELPDGVFSRLSVPIFSEDELILAISECTVLLQEGRDALGRGSFGSWTLLEALALATKDQLVEMQDLVEAAAGIVAGSGFPGPGGFANPASSNGFGGAR